MKRKGIITTILCVSLMFSWVPVYADTINVSLNGLNIHVNGINVAVMGESYEVQDGINMPYSILYNGTTYLPMRKVAEFMGKSATWDQLSKTAAISDTDHSPLLSASSSTPAPGITATINVTLNGINIENSGNPVAKIGEPYILLNKTSVPYSILYEGTTYLPMRKMASFLDKWIAYDAKIKTVVMMDAVLGYSENPNVPDFGLLCGQDSLEIPPMENMKTAYAYNLDGITDEQLCIFNARLEEAGYYRMEYELEPMKVGGVVLDGYLDPKTARFPVIAGKVRNEDSGEEQFVVYLE